MKRTSCVAVGVFLSFLWIPIVIAAPNTGAATQKQRPQVQQNSTQSGKAVQPKAGIDWKNKVLKEREIKKRAAARRNVLMQQAEKEKSKKQQNAPSPAMNP